MGRNMIHRRTLLDTVLTLALAVSTAWTGVRGDFVFTCGGECRLQALSPVSFSCTTDRPRSCCCRGGTDLPGVCSCRSSQQPIAPEQSTANSRRFGDWPACCNVQPFVFVVARPHPSLDRDKPFTVDAIGRTCTHNSVTGAFKISTLPLRRVVTIRQRLRLAFLGRRTTAVYHSFRFG